MIHTRKIGNHTELYIDKTGGDISETTYITQAGPTVFHDYWTRRILAPGETRDDFIEVTAARRAELEAIAAAWQPPSEELKAAWRAACMTYDGQIGDYNEQTGYFEAEDLKDITTEQAITALVETAQFSVQEYAEKYPFHGFETRILLPVIMPKKVKSFSHAFYGQSLCRKLETICRQKNDIVMSSEDFAYVFGMTPNIKNIFLKIEIPKDVSSVAFLGLTKLEFINFTAIHGSFGTMYDSTSYETIKRIIDVTTTDKPINIRSGTGLIAKLTGDLNNSAVAAMTVDELKEWMALVPLAAAKNITFVST